MFIAAIDAICGWCGGPIICLPAAPKACACGTVTVIMGMRKSLLADF
eukprot:COSAG01_NODE_34964_length_539_cov_0.902273_1_plen_47_part_00